MLSPRDQCFLHTLLPCIIMSTNINTRVSGHTQPADMVHIVSFQPSVVSGCSKPAAKSTGKIKLHELHYLLLMVQHSSLAGQTNQHPGVFFFMGRVRWAAEWWVGTSGSLLQASWAASLVKACVVCLQRWLQAQVIGWEKKSPATLRCAGSVKNIHSLLSCSPGCLGRKKIWCSLFPHVRSHGHLWVWRSLLYLQGLCNEAVNESLADLFYNCQSSQKQPRISLTKIKAWFPISSFQILLDIDKLNQYFIYVPPKLVGTVLFIQEYYSSGLLFEKSSCTTGCSRFFNKWLCYRNKSTGEKVTWTWAEHNLSEDKWGDVGIWEKRMAPPCHHGWEKVQDNYGSIKAGASDGWKEFIRAPDKVKGGKCLCLHMS